MGLANGCVQIIKKVRLKVNIWVNSYQTVI